jgi:HlyD family secretion protein
LALLVAFWLNQPPKAQPPAFEPAASPYAHAIYAEGIVESDQTSGENINILPEVSGRITAVLAQEGQAVHAGQPLFTLDDTVQRGVAEQARAQSQAALALLEELKAEPRRETLAVADAQLEQARANAKTLEDERDKLKASFAIDPRSVSRQALDAAVDGADAGRAAVELAARQLSLVKAGAWTYDVRSQEAQYQSLSGASESAKALLDKYVVRAPSDGVVLAINASNGAFASSQGVYDSYTQQYEPAAVLGSSRGALAVRVYVDEVLLSRLPNDGKMRAELVVRGSGVHQALDFVRIQPYVTPKVELSDQRQERVDLRVLPVIFRIRPDAGVRLYPGQLVDVYISE